MKEIYRLNWCVLKNANYELKFKFGIVYEDSGLISFDLYLVDESNTGYLELKNMINDYFELEALTENKNKLTGTNIAMTSISSSSNKIKFMCYDKIIYEEQGDNSDRQDDTQSIHFIELEGFKIEFSDITYNNKTRNGEKINDFKDITRDHTSALLIYNGDNYGCNHFSTLIYKHSENENIIFDFTKAKKPNNLSFNNYLSFKHDFIYFLAFINGAEVKVRREYTGSFYRVGEVYSQKIYTYSSSKLINKSFNDYIPISDPFYISENIIGHFFMKYFDNFIKINNKLDISSIIFYINGANQAKSIEERFFILIIAFERLANNFIMNFDTDKDHTIIPNNDFQELKKKLIKVVNEFKKEKIKEDGKFNKDEKTIVDRKYDKFISMIGQMNLTNKSVNYKFRELLKFVNIHINEDIKHILENLRHSSIHKGEIDGGEKGYKYTLVLDELIRDIILNLIEYNYIRKSKIYKERNKY